MDVVPDIEDDQINSSFDFNVEDFESRSQKNFTDVQTAYPLKRNFHNDKDSVPGGNIALDLNEEVEICNPMLSWGEDLVEIKSGNDIQNNGDEVASKVMKYANRYKSKDDVGNKQIFSDGDLVKSTGKAIRKFNYDPLELELEGTQEIFKYDNDNGDKSNVDEDNEHIFSRGEDIVEIRTGKRIRELDSDPLEFEAASKLSKYDNGDKSKVDDGGDQIFSEGGDLAKITTENGIKDLDNDYISVLNDKDIDIKENCRPIENLNNENFLQKSSHPNSTPEKSNSPQSNLSSPEEGSVPSIVDSAAVSVQEDYDIVENIEDTEEPQSEPDLILYSPRTSSDTEQDKEIIEESFMNNYIFDLFGAED